MRFEVGAASGVFSNLRSVHYIRDSLICGCLTSFVSYFGVSALCLKCTEHVGCNSDISEEYI